MNKPLSIETITDGLITLRKLKQLYVPENRNEDGNTWDVHPDKLSLMKETIMTIKNFFPDTRDGSFSNAINQGNKYGSVYRELKSHLKNMNRNAPDSPDVTKTLKLISSLLDNRHKIYLDKAVKIIDILQS
ncbi:MAG: hypothetical protein ACM3XR_08295 [Bacillota bacterium]